MKLTTTSVLFLLVSSSYSSKEAEAPLLATFDASSLLKNDAYLSEEKGFFEPWMTEFNKGYDTAEEVLHRLHIWVKNDDLIKKHNNKESSYGMGHNQFSDMTWDEFQEYNKLGSYSPDTAKTMMLKTTAMEKEDHRRVLSDEDDVPEEWDWVEHGGVPPVKDQKMCGSCWAFSAIGAIEGARYVDTGNLTALSEQELVDCDKVDLGCGGGLMDNAFLFDENTTHGICAELDYPYVAHKHWFRGCRSKDRHFREKICTSVKHSRVESFVDIENTVPALKAAIVKQTVSVAIQANLRSFQFYKKGIYDDEKCGNDLDHGVVAVGYGTEDDVPYFLVRNSWGPKWGDEGYIKMAQVSKTNPNGTCGILSAASRPILRENGGDDDDDDDDNEESD